MKSNKDIKVRVRKRLLAQSSGIFNRDRIDPQELRGLIGSILDQENSYESVSLSMEAREKVINELVDELVGFGPIEKALKDPGITEIMINGPRKVFIEKNGKTVLSDIVFDDEQQLMSLIYKILAPTRRRVDESFPYVDLSMPDGSRVNIIIPPLAVDGPTVTIRKFSPDFKKTEDLIARGTLDARMAEFLVAAIKAKLNIVFSGATGVGKTTTLNVLSGYIDNQERILTIEDTSELMLRQEHVVRLEGRPQNIEGKGEVSIRDLFKNSLRMRPERLILGEIRGAEALDMLQAICSGHTGSLSVLHANSPEDVIYRLETMILMSGVPITLDTIHRQIAAAINLIVHQEQLADGVRKVTHIAEVAGLKDGRTVLQDIFTYEQENFSGSGMVMGKWKAHGVVPRCLGIIRKAGVTISETIFTKE